MDVPAQVVVGFSWLTAGPPGLPPAARTTGGARLPPHTQSLLPASLPTCTVFVSSTPMSLFGSISHPSSEPIAALPTVAEKVAIDYAASICETTD